MKKADIIAPIICVVFLLAGAFASAALQKEKTEGFVADVIPTIETEALTEAPTKAATVPAETKAPTEPPVDPEDLEMLAILIYQEAGSDSCCDLCRRRVADVALNRVADPRFPSTLEGVLMHEGQYGRFHWTGIKWPQRSGNPGEAAAVERARRIAREVMQGQHSDLYGAGYVWQAGFHQGRDEIHHCGIYFGR